jgi:hypothetical protein
MIYPLLSLIIPGAVLLAPRSDGCEDGGGAARCARCLHRSEQKRASDRVGLKLSPQDAHAIGSGSRRLFARQARW